MGAWAAGEEFKQRGDLRPRPRQLLDHLFAVGGGDATNGEAGAELANRPALQRGEEERLVLHDVSTSGSAELYA
jgi:hypothetical protein